MSSTKIGKDKDELLGKLAEWNIQTETIEHPQVFTVEQALPHLENTEGKFAKNLFLKDKKKRLYLFCAPHDAEVKLNDLAKMVGASGGLRFADSSVLEEKLGILEGSVTVFGIINDTENEVKVVLDQRLLDQTYPKVWFHPMVNSATTSISSSDLKIFIDKTNHELLVINLS
ncbi:prolyl-tRNA synthetase associated domain-containing protein 1-like [Saccostrea echinata]|uniref:prolyl-tRNA synthetase associated domain-containing protein 1-like n=1 Tax=Saccostrea echinata TaxID=191078 RepID=UPI002A8345FC|nr:prolyl-tRNA synthetase associated domain-containing protein 1-like [Saccostrea echinata]